MFLLAFAENSIQLVPDGTIFFHIFLILLMIFVLNRTLFKPINRILAERDRKTGGRSTEAADILRDADVKLANYEKTLRETRAAGYASIEQMRTQALQDRQLQVDEVKAEITEMVAGEKDVLNSQIASAQKQLKTEAAILAERISANILKRSTI